MNLGTDGWREVWETISTKPNDERVHLCLILYDRNVKSLVARKKGIPHLSVEFEPSNDDIWNSLR